MVERLYTEQEIREIMNIDVRVNLWMYGNARCYLGMDDYRNGMELIREMEKYPLFFKKRIEHARKVAELHKKTPVRYDLS